MPTLEQKDPDVVARARTSLPGRKRCRPDADVVTRALKFGVFMKEHPSHAAPVVARAHALSPARIRMSSPERRCCCPNADVVAGVLKFEVFVKKHPSHAAPVVARAQTLSLAHMRTLSHKRMRSRVGAGVTARAYMSSPERGCFARAPTALVTRRRLRVGVGDVARAGPVCTRTSEGIKGPAFPSLFTFLPSEVSWPGPALQQLLARTSRIGLWLSFLIVLFVYVNRIGAPLITFIFLITSVHSTCLASCKNGEAKERDKGVGAMVYVATGWTYGEPCVLWRHNAVQKRTGL